MLLFWVLKFLCEISFSELVGDIVLLGFSNFTTLEFPLLLFSSNIQVVVDFLRSLGSVPLILFRWPFHLVFGSDSSTPSRPLLQIPWTHPWLEWVKPFRFQLLFSNSLCQLSIEYLLGILGFSGLSDPWFSAASCTDILILLRSHICWWFVLTHLYSRGHAYTLSVSFVLHMIHEFWFCYLYSWYYFSRWDLGGFKNYDIVFHALSRMVLLQCISDHITTAIRNALVALHVTRGKA